MKKKKCHAFWNADAAKNRMLHPADHGVPVRSFGISLLKSPERKRG